MKKVLLIILWAVFWLAMQSTLLSEFPSRNAHCDIIFLTVVAVSFSKEFWAGFPFVFLLGIFSDGVSINHFGLYTIVYLAAFSVIRFINSMIYVHSIIGRFVWTFFATIFAVWLSAALIALADKNSGILTLTLWRFLQQAVWNGLLGIAVIPLFYRYEDTSLEKIFKPKGLLINIRGK